MVRDDYLALLQELVGHSHAFVEQSSGIAAKIEDQALHIAKMLQRLLDFVLRGLVETADMHVSDAGLNFKLEVHGIPRNLGADHVEFERLFRTLPQDRDVDVGAFRSLEQV